MSDVVILVALVAVTAFLFGLVEYRRHRPLTGTRNAWGVQTPEGCEKIARARAITRVLEVVAAAVGSVTTVVLVVRVVGALL